MLAPDPSVKARLERISQGGRPRVLDLFSGCGGLSLGFHSQGFEIAAAVEFDREAAASHGWSISDKIDIFELLPPENLLDEKQQQSLLYSSDLELGETTTRIFEAMERVKPERVVLDSLSEIRLLAQNSLRYRRQILGTQALFRATGRDGPATRRPDRRNFG